MSFRYSCSINRVLSRGNVGAGLRSANVVGAAKHFPGLGEANLDLAVRQTKYSTSGNVTAWKVGGTWKTPIEGLSFRAVTSRDIRAPNLSELFAPGKSRRSRPARCGTAALCRARRGAVAGHHGPRPAD